MSIPKSKSTSSGEKTPNSLLEDVSHGQVQLLQLIPNHSSLLSLSLSSLLSDESLLLEEEEEDEVEVSEMSLELAEYEEDDSQGQSKLSNHPSEESEDEESLLLLLLLPRSDCI